MIALIAAMGRNRVIGHQGKIPWRLPADMQHFKRTTMGKPILMGRKTWESLPGVLPGRRNIVMTRNRDYVAEGADIVSGIEAAMAITPEASELMVIGGQQLYEQILPSANTLYLTEIDADFEGDAWFPEFDPDSWVVASEQQCEPDERNPYRYCFKTYRRL